MSKSGALYMDEIGNYESVIKELVEAIEIYALPALNAAYLEYGTGKPAIEQCCTVLDNLAP